jgi:hypothetical protein
MLKFPGQFGGGCQHPETPGLEREKLSATPATCDHSLLYVGMEQMRICTINGMLSSTHN